MKEEEIFRWDLCRLYKEYGLEGDPFLDVRVMLDTLGRRSAFPETREVVERLSQEYLVAIGSTTDTEPLLRDLKKNGLEMNHVFTSESLRVYKPQEAFYQKILDRLQVKADEALFVGDSLLDDVWGPQRVGIRACWVNRKGEKAAEIAPNLEMPDLQGLPAKLSGL